MYVFVTSQAERSAKVAGLKDQIDRVESQLAGPEARISGRFKPLGHKGYWKKRIAPSHRAIAKVCIVEGEQIACILDVLPRDIAYDDFPTSVEQYIPSFSELHSWLSRRRAEAAVVQVPETLPLILQTWLQPPAWDFQDFTDIVVYETEEWVRRFRQPKVRDYWQTFLKLVQDACGIDKLGEGKLSSAECHILYRRLRTADQPCRDVLLLLGADKDGTAPTFNHPAYLDKLLSGPVKIDDLIGFVSRCYPAYLAADADTWRQIEFNDEANLALSAEEEQILTLASQGIGSASLPIFINGRAGSGKSTMLGYLFADYCERYLKLSGASPDRIPRPAFLAYNDKLLDVVKKSVLALLRSHHRFLRDRSNELDLGKLDDCFIPFQRYLLATLRPTDRARFAPERYISFYRFKRLYSNDRGADASLTLKLPAASEFSPELAWYVIRTLIKGSSRDDFLSPDEYQAVAKKDRIVSLDQYRSVHNTIWEQWYKHLNETNYWDDQDLVRHVINNGQIVPEFAAIFCDEAQDFTRLELTLLMQLSVLSKYALDAVPVQSLPFAFAGDPFQTLNPTGFRSSALRGTFHDEIIKAIDPTGQHDVEMNVFELSCNYRSDPGIVKVTNLIQLWRKVLFSLELQPQRWLEKGELPVPTRFVLGRNITITEVRALLTNMNTITILPCEEDEVLSFISCDDVLADAIADNNEVPPNVFSVMSIKGLEFPRVVLYKFGERCDPAVWKDSSLGEGALHHEYYFNKLYVAATRPKHSLFIVDSETGHAALWRFAESPDALDSFLSALETTEERRQWESHVALIQEGVPDTATDLREENREAIAEELFSKGKAQQNPELLRRAKRFYLSLGQQREVDLSEALALQLEAQLPQQHKAAGDLFLKCDERKLAADCYWQAESWQDVLESSRSLQERGIRFRVSQFMLSSNTAGLLGFMEWLQETLNSESTTKLSSRQWNNAVSAFVSRAGKLAADALQQQRWLVLSEVLVALHQRWASTDPEIVARICYRGKNYARAAEFFERAGKIQSPDYYEAKAATCSGADHFDWLSRAGKYEAILNCREQIQSMSSSERRQCLPFLAQAFEHSNNHWEAFNIHTELGSTDKMLKALDLVISTSNSERQSQAMTAVLESLLKRGDWAEGLNVASRFASVIPDFSNKHRGELLALIRGFAHSSLGPESLSGSHHERFAQLMLTVQQSTRWRADISPQILGAALERVGGLVDILKYYESLEDDSDLALQKFSAYRWLVTKKKQEQLYRQRENVRSGQKAEREYANKLHDWEHRHPDFRRSEIDKEPPYPSLSALQTSAAPSQVSGLPADVRVQDLGTGVRIKVVGVEIATNWSAQKLLFTTDDLSSVSVNLQTNRVVSDGVAVEWSFVNGVLQFDIPALGCKGVSLSSGEPLRVSLTFKTLAEPVVLDFPPASRAQPVGL